MMLAFLVTSYVELPLVVVFLILIAGVLMIIFRSPNFSTLEERRTFCTYVSVWHPALFSALESEWDMFLWMKKVIHLFEEMHGAYECSAMRADVHVFLSAKQYLPNDELMERMRHCCEMQRQSYLYARAQFVQHVPRRHRASFAAAFPPDDMCE